jgi:hypothetical protein
MSNCTAGRLNFSPIRRRTVAVNSDGGFVSSDGGVLLFARARSPGGLTRCRG